MGIPLGSAAYCTHSVDPGNPADKNVKGCNYLIKTQQAILIESAEDIIKGLNWDVKEKVIQQKIYKKNIYFFCFLEKYYTFTQNLEIKRLINTNKYGTENP